MTTYTLISAAYANVEGTAAVILTEEVAAKAISAEDAPELWAEMLAWGEPAAFLAPRPPVQSISDRQFAQQLAVIGTITQAEAIAWAARGDLPDAMEAAVAALPAGDQFAARMLLSSATTYEFDHPLGAALGAVLGFDEDARRGLWLAAALL